MILAVIPARGGSKRIPRKNIKPFAGRPMIAYAIRAALDSGVFDRVIVSTDDDEIAAVAESLGAEAPFRRPPELANDHAATLPVIQHAIDALAAAGEAPRDVCCIYPCVPFLLPEDLRQAQQLVADDGLYVTSVTHYAAPVQRALRRHADGRIAFFYPEFEASRTQDLEEAYHDAGQFYWGRASTWKNGKALLSSAKGYPIPSWRAVDIDTPDDWTRAEMMHRALHAKAA